MAGKDIRLKLIPILILTLVVIVSSLLFYKFIYPTLGWDTFISKRVSLSFKHPKNWPVSPCDDPAYEVSYYQLLKKEELVIFGEHCDFGRDNNSIGNIEVEKVENVENPKEYLIKKNASPFSPKNDLQIESKRLGMRVWYITHFKSDSNGKFENYYTFEKGLQYKASLVNRNYLGKSKKQNINIFEQILSTISL